MLEMLSCGGKVGRMDIIPTSGNLPGPRAYVKMVCANNELFCYGGWNGTQQLRDMCRYSLAQDRWTVTTPANGDGRHSYGMCANDTGSNVFILYSAGVQQRTSFLNFNTASSTMTSTALGSTPTPRQELALAMINGAGYMFGGWAANDALLNDTWRWNLSTGVFTNLNPASPPPSRKAHACGTLDGKLYILGGVGPTNNSGRLSDFWCYDPAQNTWTRKADFPINIANTTLLGLNGQLFVFGGLTTAAGRDVSLNIMYAYSPNSDSWTALSTPAIGSKHDHCGAVMDGKLWYFAGLNGDNTFSNQLLRYTP